MFEERVRGPGNTVSPNIRQLYMKDVMLAISKLDKIRAKYNQKRLNRSIATRLIRSDSYFNMFVNIIKYLVDLRGGHTNYIGGLLYDYFDSVYEYYSRFGRVPYTNQLSPTDNNTIRFEEWIANRDSQYWDGGKIFAREMTRKNKEKAEWATQYSQADAETRRKMLISKGILVQGEDADIVEI